MPDETNDDVVPIDAEVRKVLEEFAKDPVAMASEIVRLRFEIADERRPPPEIVLPPTRRPPDGPPPIRFGGG